MALEIERKFLVDARRLPIQEGGGTPYVQGYLSKGPASVRIRIAGPKAFLTVKGPASGISRPEFEYPIPVADAQAMLERLCLKPLIDKTRHRIPHGGHTWEVDVFHGANDGLVVAEIELGSEAEAFVLPPWVTTEVTDDPRYLNANLGAAPYSSWT
jgi:adenylate cyclase